jgi:hypothetical protein
MCQRFDVTKNLEKFRKILGTKQTLSKSTTRCKKASSKLDLAIRRPKNTLGMACSAPKQFRSRLNLKRLGWFVADTF